MKKRLLKIAFLLGIVYSVEAQTEKNITLDEAIRLGLENSKTLKTSSAKVAVIQAKLQQQKNMLIPVVSANIAYARLSNNITPFTVQFPTGAVALNPTIPNQFNNRLSLQYPIFTGLRDINTIKSTQFLEKATELDAEKDRTEVKYNIINAYLNHYKLLNTNLLIKESIATLEGRINDTRNYVAQGTALPNDVMKLEVAKAQQEQNLSDVQAAIDISNFNMDLLLGLPTETLLKTDENSAIQAQNIADANTLINASLNDRTDLKALDMRQNASKMGVEVAKGNYLPVISVGGNYYYNRPNQRVFPQEDAFKNTWDLGVSLSYSLNSLFTTKAQIQEAQANLLQMSLVKEQLSDAIKMEVNANIVAYKTAIQKIALSQKTIAQAEENQRVMKNRYASQLIILGELLDADVLLFQSKMNLLNAKADAENAYYKVLKASGK